MSQEEMDAQAAQLVNDNARERKRRAELGRMAERQRRDRRNRELLHTASTACYLAAGAAALLIGGFYQLRLPALAVLLMAVLAGSLLGFGFWMDKESRKEEAWDRNQGNQL